MFDTESQELRARLETLLRSRLSGAVPESVGDKRHYVVRCRSGEMRARLPFSLRAEVVTEEAKAVHLEALRSRSPDGTRGALDALMAERAKDAGKDDKPKSVMFSGTASSTSVDWYGTEMSLRALQHMAAQFNNGVDMTPRHNSWLSPLEWNDVMGRTIMAAIEQTDVAAKADKSTDPGFVLNITADCMGGLPVVQDLASRLDLKQPIGMSIGGWFTEIRYICNADGECERIIIEAVELDHVAVVRNPANPDCLDLEIMRSVASAEVRALAASVAPAMAAPEADRSGEVAPVAAEVSVVVTEPVPAERSAPVAASPPDLSSPTTEPARAADDAPEASNRQPVCIDDSPAPRNDDAEVGTRSASDPTPEDYTMTPEQIAALVADTVRSVLAAERAAAPPPVAPVAERAAPVGDSADVIALRASLAAAESRAANTEAALAHLAEQPARRGTGLSAPLLSGNPEFARSEFEELVVRTKAERGTKPSSLAAVATRAKAVLLADIHPQVLLSKSPEGASLRAAAHRAPDTLRALLNGAEQDGMIGNLQIGWQ